jgi:uncharacterized protein (UPF0297 family)
MRKLDCVHLYDERENFKIEDNVFLHASICGEVQSKFVKELIEKELGKPFEEIEKKDSKKISDIILSLTVSERLHAIEGILEYYSLSNEDPITKTVEKTLADKRFNPYRDLIMTILSTTDNTITEEERLSAQKKVEKFEKENNIEILVEN